MSNKKLKAGFVLIRFLLSPTGMFNLGYSAGDTAQIEEKQAAELVEAKYAEYVSDSDTAPALTKEEVLANENAALKKLNEEQAATIEELKERAKEQGLQGNLPIGATNDDLTNTISSIPEAQKAVDTFDTLISDVDGATVNAATTGTITEGADAAGNATGAQVTKAGEETNVAGENGAPDTKITKGATK